MHNKNKMAGDELKSMLEQIASLKNLERSFPLNADDAKRKLKARAFDDQEISARVAAFRTNVDINKTAVLANYQLLHGIPYLERTGGAGDAQSCGAGAILSVFRCAEVCLHNLSMLARQMTENLVAGAVGAASNKARWCTYFQSTLYALSQLIIEMDDGSAEGSYLSISDSIAFSAYRDSIVALHDLLRTDAVETEWEIANHDLDDPRRFVGFNEYVNRNYELIWFAALNKVRLPGVSKPDDLTDREFFRTAVCSEDIRNAVESVDLISETSLTQFRAYHQLSELLVMHINKSCGVVVTDLLSKQDDGALEESVRILTLCNKLLRVVNDNITPIVRALSPRAYSLIRPALGITSGSHSINLRKGLFDTIYPLLVRAIRLRISNYSATHADDDAQVYSRAVAALRNKADALNAEIMRQIVYVHQHVRVWRDEHMQFIKSQIGISPEHETPTASISGSENAAQTAQRFRNVHTTDPIAPLYRAVLGRYPAAPFSLLGQDAYDAHMAHLTARAVTQMYPDVQHRVQVRRAAMGSDRMGSEKKGAEPGGGPK